MHLGLIPTFMTQAATLSLERRPQNERSSSLYLCAGWLGSTLLCHRPSANPVGSPLALIVVLAIYSLPNVVVAMAEKPRSRRELEHIMRTSQTREEMIKRYSTRRWEVPLITLLTSFSILLWVVAIVLLWVRLGWILALGFIVLSLGYITLRKSKWAKEERAVRRVRASLRESIAQRNAGGDH